MAGADARVRPYVPGEEAAILALWRRALPQDPITPQIFTRKVLADPNVEPEGLLIAEVEGRPAGFLVAIVRRVALGPNGGLDPDDGWITAFGVDPDLRRRGVASALLAAGERFVASRGRSRVSVSPYAPNYFWPGVERARHGGAAATLAGRGYRATSEEVAMDRSLVGFFVPEDVDARRRALEAEGFSFRALTMGHVIDLAEFAERAFNLDWARSCREAVARGLPLEQTLVCVQDGRVCGFAQYGAYDHAPDRFGPFGVDDRLRGKGIGKVMLYLVMERLAALGFHATWFLWTLEDSPAGHLYRRAGFSVTSRFTLYTKDLVPTRRQG